MSIKLKLEGFDELLKDIEAAGRSMTDAAESAMKGSAQIMQSELKSEMRKSGVKESLIGRMPKFQIGRDWNKVTAYVGYDKGEFVPKNPSDGYKVIFLNYGTPHRKKHGKIVDVSQGGKIALGFVQRAKKTAKPKIKKQQKQALEKILQRLKK